MKTFLSILLLCSAAASQHATSAQSSKPLTKPSHPVPGRNIPVYLYCYHEQDGYGVWDRCREGYAVLNNTKGTAAKFALLTEDGYWIRLADTKDIAKHYPKEPWREVSKVKRSGKPATEKTKKVLP